MLFFWQTWCQHPLIWQLSQTLLHSLWQIALLGLLFLASLLVIRSPQWRYMAGMLTLLAMLVVPPAAWMIGKMPVAAEPVAVMMPANIASHAALELPPTDAIAESAIVEKPSASISFWPLISLAWLLGMTIMSLRLMLGWAALRRIRRHAESANDELLAQLERIRAVIGLRLHVAIKVSADIASPILVGIARPMILIPASLMTGTAPEILESMIAHELAHVRRHDPIFNLFQMCVETLLFYHPAVWILSRYIRTQRELCTDDLAAHVIGSKLNYARALSAMDDMRDESAQLALAAARGPLVKRIRHLIAPKAEAKSRWVSVTAAIVLLCVPVMLVVVACRKSGGTQEASTQAVTTQKSDRIRIGLISRMIVTSDPDLADLSNENVLKKMQVILQADAESDRIGSQETFILSTGESWSDDKEVLNLHWWKDLRTGNALEDVLRLRFEPEVSKDRRSARAKLDYTVKNRAIISADEKYFAPLLSTTAYLPSDQYMIVGGGQLPESIMSRLKLPPKLYQIIFAVRIRVVTENPSLVPASTAPTVAQTASGDKSIVRVYDIRDFVLQENGVIPKSAVDEMINLINKSVPNTSRQISGYYSQLVIHDTVENHEKILGMLNQLRESRATQLRADATIRAMESGELEKVNNNIVRVYDIREFMVFANEDNSAQQLNQRIVDLIKESIATSSWSNPQFSIVAKDGLLVITQTAENHEKIRNLLEQLAEARSIMLKMEFRLVLTRDQKLVEELICCQNLTKKKIGLVRC